MTDRLDALKELPVDRDALAKGRALLAAELKAPRPRSWRSDVLLVLGASWGLAALVTVVLFFAGSSSTELVARHGAALALTFVVGAVCAWAAVAPLQRTRVAVALGVGAAGLVGLVALRALGLTSPSALPQWICTVTHAGTGAVPLAVALMVLKKSAPNPLRAVLAGLAAGTCGALIGEVGCAQPWQHVLVFHLSAWLAVAAVAVLVSRRLRRSSYAP